MAQNLPEFTPQCTAIITIDGRRCSGCIGPNEVITYNNGEFVGGIYGACIFANRGAPGSPDTETVRKHVVDNGFVVNANCPYAGWGRYRPKVNGIGIKNCTFSLGRHSSRGRMSGANFRIVDINKL